jgi:hypothetical protein
MYHIAFPEEVSKAEAKHYTISSNNVVTCDGTDGCDRPRDNHGLGNWMPLEEVQSRAITS